MALDALFEISLNLSRDTKIDPLEKRRILGRYGRDLGHVSMYRRRSAIVAISIASLALLFEIRTGGLFFVPMNLANLLAQNALLIVLTPGMFFVLLTGRLDLSVGSVVAFVGAVLGIIMVDWGAPTIVALPVALTLGALIGAFHGYLIGYLRIPMFIATLSGMLIWRGLTLVVLQGETKAPFDVSILALIRHDGKPTVAILGIVVVATYLFLARRTIFGRHVYALGANPETARLSGVRARRILLAVYANSGFLAAVAGIIAVARLNAATPKAGTFLEIEVITACLIGGVSARGGIGGVGGAFLGAILVGVLNNGMSLLSLPGQDAIRAAVLLAAGALDATISPRRP